MDKAEIEHKLAGLHIYPEPDIAYHSSRYQSLLGITDAGRHRQHSTPMRVYRGAGRVNLLGNHIDHNGGATVSASIDRDVLIGARYGRPGQIYFSEGIWSIDFSIDSENLPGPDQCEKKHWSSLIAGMFYTLFERGYLKPEQLRERGIELFCMGDLEQGVGLSSSAAFELAILLAVSDLYGMHLPTVEMARIAKRAENEFFGKSCGIGDQYASLNGREKTALSIDFRDPENPTHQEIPFDPDGLGYSLVVVNSGVKRDGRKDPFNSTPENMRQGVHRLRKLYPGIRFLGDVTDRHVVRELEAMQRDNIRDACLHFYTERQRVYDGSELLRRGDFRSFCRLMEESHMSSRDYARTTRRPGQRQGALDVLAELGWEYDGCLGSSLFGGGFGGCTKQFVRKGSVEDFQDYITRMAEEKGLEGVTARVYHIKNGSCRVI